MNAARSCRQRGMALILALVLLFVGWAGWLLAGATGRPDDSADMAALLRARDALISRAVGDANRPGALPCPDRLTHLASNQPNDGIADLLSGNECPSNIGWLPWATLDLGDVRDRGGSRLWYALSRHWRDDDSAQPINSDTPATLSLDGAGDIVAILIAPQAARPGQNRPSLNIGDFLEGSNADGDEQFTARRGPAANDLVLALRRSELMAAVERRVINEVRNCLRQHATASGRLPWPAPPGRPGRQSRPGSLFGRLPQTAASSGLSLELGAQLGALQSSGTRLAGLPPDDSALAAATALADQLTVALAYFDQTWMAARRLATAADLAGKKAGSLDQALLASHSKTTLSDSEISQLQRAAQESRDALAALLAAVSDSGIDALPARLARQAATLRSAAPSGAASLLAAHADPLQLLELGATPNPTIAGALAAANTAGLASLAAAQEATGSPSHLPQAARLAGEFAAALEALRSAIASQRLNVPADEIDGIRRRLLSGSASQEILDQRLAEGLALLNGFSSANSAVRLARDDAIGALSLVRQTPTGSRRADALAAGDQALNALAEAMRQNGDNLGRLALEALVAATNSQFTTSGWLGDPSARQQASRRSQDLAYLSQLLASHAATLATAGRRAVDAATDDPASLYALAEHALTSLTGSQGSIERLKQAVASPGSSTRRTAASSALAASVAALDQLLTASRDAGPEQFAGGMAEAAAILWQGSACAFLQTGSGAPSWWASNAWEQLVFLQISAPSAAAAGRLTINGQGEHIFVVIAAGGTLPGQQRPNSAIAHYLEAENAAPGRDGDAEAPPVNFRKAAPGAAFNDQLAY